MKKLIILDRDGVINHDSDDYIKSPQEWQPIDGSLEAIARLNHAGYRVVVATNQSGIARKLFSIDTLIEMHNKMLRLTEEVGGHIEAIFFAHMRRKMIAIAANQNLECTLISASDSMYRCMIFLSLEIHYVICRQPPR